MLTRRRDPTLIRPFDLPQRDTALQMERALDYVLSGIAWPKETLLEYEFSHDVSGIALDIDLPDEGMCPTELLKPGAMASSPLKPGPKLRLVRTSSHFATAPFSAWLGRFLPCSQASKSALLPGTFSAQIWQREYRGSVCNLGADLS